MRKKSPEQIEKDEIFKDVLNIDKDNSKQIKKFEKSLDRKFFRFLVALLLFLSIALLSYDIHIALTTDVWQPITINDLLSLFNLKELHTNIGVIDWLIAAPLFISIGILGVLIFAIF